MTDQTRSLPAAAGALVRTARTGHAGLFALAVGSAVAAVAFAVASLIDPRTVLGAEVWIKPLKFAISFTLYGGALALLLGAAPTASRAVRRAGSAIVVAALIELVIIVGQAARGVRSHFNVDTPFDAVLFDVMGATIAVLYAATILVAVAAVRPGGSASAVAGRSGQPDAGVLTRGVQAGLLITVLGLSVGFFMVARSAHTVGAPDGGPGLPFVGWSTVAGDLRIGHFVGLHALQALPIAALVLAAVGRGRWTATTSRRLVTVAASAYAGLVLLVTAQALRGQPLLAPDVITLGLAVALVAAVGVAAGLVLRADQRPRFVVEAAEGALETSVAR